MEPVALPPTLTMIRCDRRAMTLTTAGCGRLWAAAQAKHADGRLEPWEGIATCRTCPIGAKNAGREADAVFEPAAALACICPRCDRPAARLINDLLCISCYNRDLEAKRGRDAKGRRPKLCDQLHDERLAVMADGAARIETVPRVIGPLEAMLRVARHAKAPMSFGWAPAP